MTTLTAPMTMPPPLAMREVLGTLFEGHTLDHETAHAFMNAVFAQQVSDAQLGAALGILRQRGESPEELAGFLRAMLEHSLSIDFEGDILVDPVGTGGDGLNTYNISTMTAVVMAGMDIPVAKHGNRKASSRSGSSDALEAAGVPIISEIPRLEQALRDVGITFLFAPNHHPVLRHVAELRRSIGVMTSFNLLGPLANPAPVTHQLLGVARADILEDYAKAAASRGVTAYIVHGDQGADEALPSGDFLIVRGADRPVERVDPRIYGAIACELRDLQGGSPEQNARVLWEVLEGRGAEPVTHAVALNVALMLEMLGRADSHKDAFEQALHAIRSGQSAERLHRYIKAVSEVSS